MAFRREAFEAIGGLLDLSGYHKPVAEDLEFSLRLKKMTRKRIAFCKEAFVWHRVHPYRVTWRFIGQRSRHIGASRYVLTKLGVPMDREKSLLLGTIQDLPVSIATSQQRRLSVLMLSVLVAINVAIGYAFAMARLYDDVNPFLEKVHLMELSRSVV